MELFFSLFLFDSPMRRRWRKNGKYNSKSKGSLAHCSYSFTENGKDGRRRGTKIITKGKRKRGKMFQSKILQDRGRKGDYVVQLRIEGGGGAE